MYYRRKIILSVLQLFGGTLSKTSLQKYLFLINVDRTEPYFNFIPYKYGCFSFQANQDMLTLKKYKILSETEKTWTLSDNTNYVAALTIEDQIKLTDFYKQFKNLKEIPLIRYVYEQYPYYAINSSIAARILSDEKLSEVNNNRPHKEDPALFTIGYEGKTVEYFTNQLIINDIKAVCDVRKNPVSMKYGFSKNQLKNILEKVRISYFHFPELGIESNKRQQLNCKDDYEKLFSDYELRTLPEQKSALEKLHALFISNKRIALTCFEADHKSCHRSRTAMALHKLIEKEYLPINL